MNPAISYLNSFTNFESLLPSDSKSFNLARVERLFDALGNPQKKLKFIHVAGTKGKGSTCAMTAYILRAAGHRVGLYTSPHLYHVNERIRILDPKATANQLKDDFYGSISDAELSALVKKFQPKIDAVRHESGGLTYFEVLTGLALCYFAGKRTDIVVLETGLGGRLDATNAVDAIVNGITPVSFDHMAQLGNTIRKIAGEKAAIIKNSCSKVVVGKQSPEAKRVIVQRCRTLGITPIMAAQRIHLGVSLSLAGEHQLQNAAMAVRMVESCGLKVKSSAIAKGLRETRWPARFEIVGKNPTVVIDCAHNAASAEVLKKTLAECFPKKKITFILGLSHDKDIKGICSVLAVCASMVITTQSRHPRAYAFSGKEIKRAIHAMNIEKALAMARQNADADTVIVVAGSVFIAAEARRFIK